MLQVARPARPEHAQRAQQIVDERKWRREPDEREVLLRRADHVAAIVEFISQAAARLELKYKIPGHAARLVPSGEQARINLPRQVSDLAVRHEPCFDVRGKIRAE